MNKSSVLLDTSFFIRFLLVDDPLNKNADDYFRYFIENNISMIISTISIAEYCVKGNVNELPLNNLQILPFNFEHSLKTGELAKIVFQSKNQLNLKQRNLIPNDTKLFSQADISNSINYYLSSDSESIKIFNLLKTKIKINFDFIDLKIPTNEYFNNNQLF